MNFLQAKYKTTTYQREIMFFEIYCAQDTDFAQEICKYLEKQGYKVKVDGSAVIASEEKISKKILESFLKENNKKDYVIRELHDNAVLVSREVPLDRYGLVVCGYCSYLATPVEMMYHERSHELIMGATR